MNLKKLTKLIPMRIYDIANYSENIHRPVIRIYDKEQRKEITWDTLFTNIDSIFMDFNILATIWDDLIPDGGCSIDMKHLEILQWLGGKRSAYDILVIIEWIKSDCDIDNWKLLQEIQSEDKL